MLSSIRGRTSSPGHSIGVSRSGDAGERWPSARVEATRRHDRVPKPGRGVPTERSERVWRALVDDCAEHGQDVAGAASGRGFEVGGEVSRRASLAVDGADEVQAAEMAVGAAPGRPVVAGLVGGACGMCGSGTDLVLFEDRTGRGEHRAAGGGEEPVVPDLGEAAREHVLRTAPAGACPQSSVHEARS